MGTAKTGDRTNPPTTLFDVALRINNTSGPVPVGGIPLGSPYVETVPPPSPFPIFWYGDIVFGAPIVYRTLTFDNATGVDFTFAGDLIHKLGENGGPELCFVAGQDLDGDNTFSESDPDCIGWFPGLSPIGELCGNGVDDNNPPDGFTDCLDPLCALDAACN